MRIEALTEEQAAEVATWRYDFPYEWYDTASDPRRVELFASPARREGLRAVVRDDGEPSASSTSSTRRTRSASASACVRSHRTGSRAAVHPGRPRVRADAVGAAPLPPVGGALERRALRAYRRAGFREVRGDERSRFVEMERPA